ncbi:phage tail protein I [Thermodesulfovibrio sp.]|uniref:phage tail protein I n=1 Tax=Thermodesulfovibrio sp. TaxID=2067987 RepID=UPI0030B553E1
MLTEIKPSSLKDKEVDSLLQSADSVLIEIFQAIINSLIYPRIDSLSGEVLDLLAWQFHIEGWELAETEEEKRALVKKAIELHRYKGTPWAVKKVFETLNLDAEIQEWFQYEGEPYKFKVFLRSIVQNEETYTSLIKLINEYKNERSWLDSIGINREYTSPIYYGFAAKDGKHYSIGPHVHTEVQSINLYTAIVQRYGMVTEIGVHIPMPQIETATYYVAGTIREAKYTVIGGAHG